MRTALRDTILLICVVLISEASAQSPYKFLLKTQPSPYDSGVVIEIHQYRLEGKKLKFASELIDSMNHEILSRLTERSLNDSISHAQNVIILTQAKGMIEKDVTIKALNDNYMKLFTEATKPTPWYMDPWKVGPAAFVAGVIVNSLIRR